ncbi:YihY/virulence factor BrkB family protein [Erythrobacter alti]|uniref:YihY/virulence factor BrkB family protein n=1 Tax=Erythrobacter alti TaxID=1896145 RepID=UPI0030F37466
MGFLENLKRAWAASGEDNISILAAGVAYYAFLAMVPLLAAGVLSYGLIADPADVADHIATLARSLPPSVAELIGDQLESMVETSASAKGMGLILSLGVAILGARAGAATLLHATALALNDDSARNFIRTNLLALAVVLTALFGAGLASGAIALSALLANALPSVSGIGAFIARLASHAIVAITAALGAAALYRKAPPGLEITWRDAIPGSVFAGNAVLVFTALFGFYVTNFGNYNATYGSLGAVVILLTWLYLVAYTVLFGAEITATAHDGNPADG